jgi:hypothetical protein
MERMKTMSKVIRPFGELAKEIVIRADVNGLVVIEAYNIQTVIAKGFRPSTQRMPMDAREMVLALIKVVQDYCTVIFASMGEGVLNHGQTNKDNDHPGQSG